MSRRLPPLNALRAFEAAGRHQSFSRAAEELRVSHSSVSRHVRGLEDRLGVQLFREHARGLKLSPEGAAYLVQITPAFDTIAEATEGLRQVPEGTVTINSEPLFATKWLIPRLSAFQQIHPSVDLRIEASRELADVARYEADIAIRFIHPGGVHPGAVLLSNSMLRPYAAPSLIDQPVTNPADLLHFPLLRDRTNGTWREWFALAGGVTAEDVPHEEWRMRSALAVEAAIAGQGVLLVSDEVVSAEVESGRLIALSDIGFREGGYYVLNADGALRRKTVRVFRDWLLAKTECWRQEISDDQPIG